MEKGFERLAIVQQLGRTYRAMLAAFEASIGHCVPRWRILLALHDAPGPRSQKQLSEALQMDPGALSRQLKALEALGWIGRGADPTDNRLTNVALTDAGRDEIRRCLPRRADFYAAVMGDLPESELRALMQSLAMLESRFNASGAGNTPDA